MVMKMDWKDNLVRKDEKIKCTKCNGTGFVAMGDGIRGFEICLDCDGSGTVNSLEYVEYLEITNLISNAKLIEWLDTHVNPDDLFDFVIEPATDNKIRCFYKDSTLLVATFFIDELKKIVEEK